MKDLIYKIYSVMLYDNQLDHDYILLYDKKVDWTGQLGWDLPYDFSGMSSYGALNKIANLDKSKEDYKQKSIDIMSKVSKRNDIPFIKTEGFLTIVKGRGSHLTNYNAYDIYWNETKSGINLHDYDVAAIWNVGSSSYSTYRIWEEEAERQKVMRERKLNSIINN